MALKFSSQISEDKKQVTLSFNCDKCLSMDTISPVDSGRSIDAIGLDQLILDLIAIRKQMLPEFGKPTKLKLV